MKRKIPLALSYSLLSAVLLSLGWLGGGGFWLLVAFVPLLWLQKSGHRGFMWWVALTFFLWIEATCWWVGLSTLLAVVFVPLVGLFFTVIPFGLYHYVYKHSPSEALQWVLFCTLWISFEGLYMYGQISFPWLTLGYGFAGEPWAVQWYSLTGSFGGSLWVLVSNILVFKAVEAIVCRRRFIVAWSLWVFLPLGFSLVQYFSYSPNSETINVAVLQPNIDPYNEKFGGLSRSSQRDIFLSLMQQAPLQTDFFVLPETAFSDNLWLGRFNESHTVDTLRWFLRQKFPHATVVTGADTYRFVSPGEPQSYTVRHLKGQGVGYESLNSALWIDSSSTVEVYNKGKLVCGVEMTPYPAFFGALDRLLSVNLGGQGGKVGTSTKRTTHKGVGVAICYEAIYGEFYTEYIKAGAQAMLIISNDGWWGNTPGHRQLLRFARLRAVETRRAIARSANTGTSAIISARGDVVQSMGWDRRGVLSGGIELSKEVTPYVLWGDIVVRVSMYVCLLSLLFFVAQRFRKKV
ncbi:MAG: apolipoprotein N-acyltransferase [Mucinivorans sp.]